LEEWRREWLAEFVAWAAKNVTGDEKGQAQIFLDHLFRALGRDGSLDIGGKPEFRIRSSKARRHYLSLGVGNV
jgi:hypothetical protein